MPFSVCWWSWSKNRTFTSRHTHNSTTSHKTSRTNTFSSHKACGGPLNHFYGYSHYCTTSVHSQSIQPLNVYTPAPPTLILCVASLTSASKITIEGMLSYYGGQQPGQTPGIFNQIQGYYWWMAGAAWNVSSPFPSLPTLKHTIGDHAILVVNRRCILQRSHHSGNAVLAPSSDDEY